MELYYTETAADKILQMKADAAHIPLGGALELLPLCNMDCKMCYVRKTKAQMDAEGRMLSCDEWLRIAQEGVKEGMLFLLLTGGEPLMYPEFKRLYVELQKMGLILSLNTNGTLIDEEWADFFDKYGCQRINITLYGKDDATYGELCRNPKGFTQVMNACRLLKERQLPFRLTCSVTPDNVEDLPELFAIAKQFEVPLSAATYMFPSVRRGIDPCHQYRLTPEESASATLRRHHLEFPEDDMRVVARQELLRLQIPPQVKAPGFSCHAGHSGFWLNWKGEMLPCGMFEEPKISLLEHPYAECWRYIVETTHNMTFCEDCQTCEKQHLCHVCPAKCYTETGRIDGKPEYVCKATDAQIRLHLKELDIEDRADE